MNWYPNPVLKFMLRLQNVQVNCLGALGAAANADTGQHYDTLALRSQLSF